MGRGLHLEGCCAILLPPLPSFFLCNQIAQAKPSGPLAMELLRTSLGSNHLRGANLQDS